MGRHYETAGDDYEFYWAMDKAPYELFQHMDPDKQESALALAELLLHVKRDTDDQPCNLTAEDLALLLRANAHAYRREFFKSYTGQTLEPTEQELEAERRGWVSDL